MIQRNADLATITLYTDQYPGYLMFSNYMKHEVINHKKSYVNGQIHTNTIEGFWSLLKRGVDGVYHAVSEKYLQNYVNEYGFRYNHRNDEKPMFRTFLERLSP